MAHPSLPKRLVGVNLKMYFDAPSTTSYITAIAKIVAPPASISTGIFLLPSYPCLTSASDLLDMTPEGRLHKTPDTAGGNSPELFLRAYTNDPRLQVILGAQNCHSEDGGAHTGEVSPLMLKQVGCRIVCLGHAERRAGPFNETDEVVATKAKSVVRNGMIPLVCIGEKSQSGIMSEGVGLAIRECTPQVMSILRAVPGDAPIIFAYEPVWAIGAQEPASADHVLAVARNLKQLIGTVEGRAEVRILYGGSAKPGTWGTLKEGLDGLFLGRFAHDVGNFERVVREVEDS